MPDVSRNGREVVRAAVESLPPHNREAEVAVIGSLMIDQGAITLVADLLEPRDFYVAKHGLIYEAARHLYDRGEAVDVLTLVDEMQRRETLDQAGGPSYLGLLSAAVPTSIHVEHYARIVAQRSILRRLIRAAEGIAAIGYDESLPADEAIERADRLLLDAVQNTSRGEPRPFAELARNYAKRLDAMLANKTETVGVASGYKSLDKRLSGFHGSDLIVIGGRTSIGKTAWMLGVIHNLCIRKNTPVACFSLEMSADQIVERLLSIESGVSLHNLRNGYIERQQEDHLRSCLRRIATAPLFVDDTPGLTVTAIRSKARRLQVKQRVELVIVDYLQFIRPAQARRHDSRVVEVGEISRGLKDLAREMNVPVIALAQLSRMVETRDGHEPQLSDIRESGSIEQDSDLVILLWRNSDAPYDERDETKPIPVTVAVKKNRHGPTFRTQLGFLPATARFVDLTTEEPTSNRGTRPRRPADGHPF